MKVALFIEFYGKQSSTIHVASKSMPSIGLHQMVTLTELPPLGFRNSTCVSRSVKTRKQVESKTCGYSKKPEHQLEVVQMMYENLPPMRFVHVSGSSSPIAHG